MSLLSCSNNKEHQTPYDIGEEVVATSMWALGVSVNTLSQGRLEKNGVRGFEPVTL